MSDLSSAQIKHALRGFKGWEVGDADIHKTFIFKGFEEAVSFVVDVSQQATRLDHHPDITIHYNEVLLELSSHDVGGVSEKDLELARAIEQSASE